MFSLLFVQILLANRKDFVHNRFAETFFGFLQRAFVFSLGGMDGCSYFLRPLTAIRMPSARVTLFSSQYLSRISRVFRSKRTVTCTGFGLSVGRPILGDAKIAPPFACQKYTLMKFKSQHVFPSFPEDGCQFFREGKGMAGLPKGHRLFS